jgi:hypothetical protein
MLSISCNNACAYVFIQSNSYYTSIHLTDAVLSYTIETVHTVHSNQQQFFYQYYFTEVFLI